MNLNLTHMKPLMEYASQIWNVGYCGDLELLDRVQGRWTRAVRGIGNVPCEQSFKQFDPFYFRGRLLRADLIYIRQIFNQQCAFNPNDVFQFPQASTTRINPYILNSPTVSLNIRKRIFASRLINFPWGGGGGYKKISSPPPNIFSTDVAPYFFSFFFSIFQEKCFYFQVKIAYSYNASSDIFAIAVSAETSFQYRGACWASKVR